jgi:uncharacterized protein YdhG (YjbR/CyaY superfamily)
MTMAKATFKNVDDYIAAQSPHVQDILVKIRATIRKAVPRATETISYGMPAFLRHGIVVYFAAFENHIGLFPPVRDGDERLMKLKAAYEGPQGNLIFPLEQPIPYALISRITKHRVKQNAEQATALPKRGKGTKLTPQPR